MNRWIKAFIFYNQNSWHKLIGEFLRPTIESLVNEGRCSDLAIYLSKYRGDHIKLILRCPNEELEDLWLEFRSSAFQFIQTNPSKDINLKYPLDFRVFKDFQNNSIERDLLELEDYGEDRSDLGQMIRSSLSNILMHFFSTNHADYFTSISLLIYLHISLFKTICPSLQMAKAKTEEFLDYWKQVNQQNYSTDVDSELNVLFRENYETLKEIQLEIWDGKIDKEMEWVLKWNNTCNSYLKAGQVSDRATFFKISNITFEHISIGIDHNRFAPLLLSFIFK